MNDDMIRFLRKLSEPLKYGALIIAGGLYIWAIMILAENDNWVGISALTTMLLAIAAFWAIWQNHNLQIKERRERLLKEIIEWATDVANFTTESFSEFTTALTTSTLGLDTRKKLQIMKWQSDAQSLFIRSQNIAQMALTFGYVGKELAITANNTIGEISKYINFLEGEVDKPKPLDEAHGHTTLLFLCAMSVLQEASKLRAKYMS